MVENPRTMLPRVAAFTETYFPTINGVTYAIQQWRTGWQRRGGRMDVVYPRQDGYAPAEGEIPMRSVPFPFYDDFQLGLPLFPDSLPDVDVVHLHGPFTLGLSGLRYARKRDVPIVASYHTPTSQYAEYLSSIGAITDGIKRAARAYERWVYGHADLMLAPSRVTAEQLQDDVGVDVPVTVVKNGVDVELFRPVDPGAFLDRHGIDPSKPVVGYTGRHGFEKELDTIVEATAGLDVTVLFGGDGPARESLERKADDAGIDAHFLGFIDREELPAFYSALDVFAFPSPVETQGLVALEAYACGTPVVGVDEGALSNTIVDGTTGYRYERGDVDAFREQIRRALAERDRLSENCLDAREDVSNEASIDQLASAYDRVIDAV
jgi:glycosyltransferase involved in cell wall biosynthesis